MSALGLYAVVSHYSPLFHPWGKCEDTGYLDPVCGWTQGESFRERARRRLIYLRPRSDRVEATRAPGMSPILLHR